MSIQSLISQKRQDRKERLQEAEKLVSAYPLLSEDEIKIKSLSLDELVLAIRNGEIKSADVVIAYSRVALKENKWANFITEPMFVEALDRAIQCDKLTAQGLSMGDMHGVPISLKDCFWVKGFDSTIGSTRLIGKPAKSNAPLVDCILGLGAIPLFKTNIPQSLLAFESSNPVFGRTENPVKRGFTPGGSSGGEACAVKIGACAIGFGGDIGGSLRIPSHYSGVYALKSTRFRLPRTGYQSPGHGMDSIVGSNGAMARSMSDLIYMTRLLYSENAVEEYVTKDAAVIPLPWREAMFNVGKKIKFGYYITNDCIHTSPACQRAVLETVDALKKSGVEVVEFKTPPMSEVAKLFVALSSADGYKQRMNFLGSDPMEKNVRNTFKNAKLPYFVRYIVAFLIKWLKKDSLYASIVRVIGAKTVPQLYDYCYARDTARNLWTKAMLEQGIDAIICPTQAVPALAHGDSARAPFLAVDTFVYNLLDFSAGIIPVTSILSTDTLTDSWRKSWRNSDGGSDFGLNNTVIYEGSNPIYNPKKMEGLPVSVQVVGKIWEEEKVLGLMEIVDKSVKAYHSK